MERLGAGMPEEISGSAAFNAEAQQRLRRYLLDRNSGKGPSVGELIRDVLQLDPSPEARHELLRVFLRGFTGVDDPMRESLRREHIRQQQERDNVHPLRIVDAGMPYDARTLEQFQERPQWPTVQKARDAVMEWVAGAGPGLITLSGPYGTGKSHLAKGAALRLHEAGEFVVYRKENDLVKEVTSHFSSGDSEVVQDELFNVPWLIIDELGATALGEWGKGFMDAIIDARWERSGWLRTLITTNLEGKDLSPRIASRLADRHYARTVRVKAEDYRIKGGA